MAFLCPSPCATRQRSLLRRSAALSNLALQEGMCDQRLSEVSSKDDNKGSSPVSVLGLGQLGREVCG